MTTEAISAATAERADAPVVAFPLHRARPPAVAGDEVVVRHAGETHVFADPEDLAQAIREFDPKTRRGLRRARELMDEAETNSRLATMMLQIASAAQDVADDRVALARTAEAAAAKKIAEANAAREALRAYVHKLKIAAAVGAALAVVAMGFGL